MNVADHALGDHFLGALVEAVAAVLSADLHDFAGLLGGRDHLLALFDGVRQRFLDVDILTRLNRRHEHGIMKVFGRGDDDGIDIGVGQELLEILVGLGRVAAHGLHAILGAREMSGVGIAYGDHLDHGFAAGVEALHQVVTARPDADPANLDLIACAERRKDGGGGGESQTARGLNEIAAGKIVFHEDLR